MIERTRVDYSNNNAWGERDATFDAFGRVFREVASMSSYGEVVTRKDDGSGNW